jgi:O-antigen/teichoic acid export membrane protein
MSSIRRQSILSSLIVYIGFALGFFNTYLFTREGGFTPAQYGLTMGSFGAIANILFAFSNLGMIAYVHKFFPYYQDYLTRDRNDLISWALLFTILGFVVVALAGYLAKDLVIRKFGAHSAELVTYYYWIFPYAFGLTIYSLLEALAWQLKHSVLTNFLQAVQLRLYTLVLITLFMLGILRGFDLFIKLFAFGYLLLALILVIWLAAKGEFHLTFSVSRVTRRFRKKILLLASLVWSGGLIFSISNFFAAIVIAAVVPQGLAFVGVFILAQNIASLIQVPQRGIISASVGPLSQAWKDKDFQKIGRIYQRSSINQLIFSLGMFALIWINFTDGVFTFHLQKNYLDARYVFLFIGMMRIVDMGTGVNSQIISTSTFWRFDFFTGIILLSLTLPLSYVLAKEIGVIGPAIADLITFTIYNGIRYLFLLRRFRMQPFSTQSVYALLLAICAYLVCHFLYRSQHGIFWIATRTITFLLLYIGGVRLFNLSQDLLPVWQTVKKRMGFSGSR